MCDVRLSDGCSVGELEEPSAFVGEKQDGDDEDNQEEESEEKDNGQERGFLLRFERFFGGRRGARIRHGLIVGRTRYGLGSDARYQRSG